MPWKEMRPMDQKVQLVSDWLSNYFSITDLSQKYGVSRKTIYKWLNRYDNYGPDGLREQSRKPNNSPNRISDDIIDLII